MRHPLQGVFLGESEKVIAIVREEGTALLTIVVELLPICPSELPGFTGRQRIITPLAEILSSVRIDVLIQV